MTSRASRFKLIKRGFEETMLLVPGWACDWRIFDSLDLEYDYLVPIEFSTSNFKDECLDNLAEYGLDKVRVLGWSMGAFLASEFAGACPDRIIGELIIVSGKIGYRKEAVDKIRGYLERSARTYLYKFYKGCFSDNDKEPYAWFERELLNSYLDELDIKKLLDGLNYLSQASLSPDDLKAIKVNLVHGADDAIAPVDDAIRLKAALPDARLSIIEGAGHMPFLRSAFKETIA